MKNSRTLHLSIDHANPRKCIVRIIDGITTVKVIWKVNYGIAITNLMAQFGCTKLAYSPLARLQFLGK